MPVRAVAYIVGAALIAAGAAGLLAGARDTVPLGWAVWFGGLVLAHDLLLVPVVLGAGALLSRLPPSLRGPMRVTAVIGGCVTAVALPLVLGLGRRAGDPSRLPLPYAANLAVVIVLTVAAGCTAAGSRAYRGGRRARSHRSGPGGRPAGEEERS
jgi:hypothetical protein